MLSPSIKLRINSAKHLLFQRLMKKQILRRRLIYDILTQSRSEEARGEEGTTGRAYVEEGLRRILIEHKIRGQFRLRKATFKGEGLQPEVQDATRERIRNTIYQRPAR